jgi:transcriptional regulator with XRE-family HTH domain
MNPISEKPIEAFSLRLREERKRLKLSQEEFGHLGGVSKTAQYLYESEKNWPTLEYLEALRLKGVDVGFIATGKRTNQDNLDWELLKNAFLLIQRSFAQRQDVSFTAEQLFDAFKSVIEAANGSTRPDIINNNALANTLLEKVGE